MAYKYLILECIVNVDEKSRLYSSPHILYLMPDPIIKKEHATPL